jgi:hypothetical protein
LPVPARGWPHAGILNVMTGRLARIIDRGRHVAEGPLRLESSARESLRSELLNLERRRQLANWAINACTLAALLVCMVITTIVAEALLDEAFRRNNRVQDGG